VNPFSLLNQQDKRMQTLNVIDFMQAESVAELIESQTPLNYRIKTLTNIGL